MINWYTTSYFYISILIITCENRQQPPWILREKDARKMAYMRVCSAFFFLLCCTTVQVMNVTPQQSKHNLNSDSSKQITVVVVWLLYSGCARIDNNWREYWEKKVAKEWCTCVCAPHFFLFYAQLCALLNNIVVESKVVDYSGDSKKDQTTGYVFCFCGIVVRE